MRIALAGYGDVGKYLLEEFCKSGNSVVLLSRKETHILSEYTVDHRITNYTVDQLTAQLADCDAVVSTLSGPEEIFVSHHLAILEACTRSPRCKRFLPSEFTINVRDFPDLPVYIKNARGRVREALRAQTDVKWTLICNGWFMDYLLPQNQRYLKDLGNGWVTNNAEKVFDMYGDGLQQVSLTSVRDTARAVTALLQGDPTQWKEHSFVAAQTLTYVEFFELLKRRDSAWTVKHVSFSEVLESILSKGTVQSQVALDHLRILGFTNANRLPEDDRLRWDSGLLEGVRGRDLNAFLDEADAYRDRIL